MKKILLVTMLAVSLAACNKQEKKETSFEESIFRQAQETVSRDLKDPSSAQFRNLRYVEPYVCGEVNAKNSFGGYVGFKKFSWTMTGGSVMSDKNDEFPHYISTRCR
jgi:hypothetical protein